MILGTESYIIGNQEDYPATVGNYTGIGRGFSIEVDKDHPIIENRELVSNYPFYERFGVEYPPCPTRGEVIIGNDVWIGNNVTIKGGVIIGNGVIVGANSVVVDNVPSFAMVAGNPARVKYYRYDHKTIGILERIKWWNWEKDVVVDRLKDFLDVNDFISKYRR